VNHYSFGIDLLAKSLSDICHRIDFEKLHEIKKLSKFFFFFFL
jgi:hypothetical protein